METSISVTLAGEKFRVELLPLGVLRAVSVQVAENLALPEPETAAEKEDRTFKQYVAIVALALATDHPKVTEEALWGMKISFLELNAAYHQVLKFSGFEVGPAKRGKDEAAAASIGA
jgi:hypothetical protein